MLLAGLGGYMTNPLPVQPAKIHCPPLRSDMLSRERLTSWLDRAAAGRLALIVAEAGFGKTTLLADWATHSKRVTSWYRLERDDRDWLTFIRHLVAGGRESDPNFAPDTFGMLHALAMGGPTRQDLIATIAREMADFGASRATGFTLIIDDYHVVDDCPDIEPIVRTLLDRTGPGFSVVLSSRSVPSFPMGKVKARGGVDSLDGEALCFDRDELERLFRDAYHRPLQADVLTELLARTEGWAALLTLAHTSLTEEGGPDPQTLVAQLSATSGDIYEFLAEEVIAGLPPELQRFLTRVAILREVDPESAALLDERSIEETVASIRHCETLGLLNRPDRESPHRFHPLVREFLVAHLTAEIGTEAVTRTHRVVAVSKERTSWFDAAWHYREAGDAEAVQRVVDGALPRILGSGDFEQAREFLDGLSGPTDRVGALIIRSRLEVGRGNVSRATSLAQQAVSTSVGTALEGLAALNLTSVLARHGFDDHAVGFARLALGGGLEPAQRMVAEASLALWASQREGSLEAVADLLAELAARQDAAGDRRYAGVSRLNLAVALLWLGDTEAAALAARRAEADLGSFPAGPERIAAAAVRLTARIQDGAVENLEHLELLIEAAASTTARDEAAVEAARVFADYGPAETASLMAQLVGEGGMAAGYQGAWAVAAGTIALRRGDVASARDLMDIARTASVQDAAGLFRAELLAARVLLRTNSPDADQAVANLRRIARLQGSGLLQAIAALLDGLSDGPTSDRAVMQVLPGKEHILSLLAEEVVGRLSHLSETSRERVRREAELRPERWASALRLRLGDGEAVARLLADVGHGEDRAVLREMASTHKWLRPIAGAMTRRLAPVVHLKDLGAVRIYLGDRPVDRNTRRKVIGLLCYVSSRAGMASTKDEVLEALWPDLGPDTASNSLHQTIYFLRRLLEADFKEGMSAGYVHFDGEVLVLDEGLIRTDSRECWRLVDVARTGDEAALDRLVRLYRGTYALDFAYEDWATTYRENLHAAVLSAVEVGVRNAVLHGDLERGIRLAQDLLAVDPTADAVEFELLRAYKAGGRHAAAAEQYAHYASYVRGELGADPPSFGDI